MRNRSIPAISDQDKDYVRSLVIYEDASLIAFDKPAGLAVQTRGNRGRCLDHLLWAFARSNGKRPRLVHRIDAVTSGLVLAAKTKPAAAHISEAFETRRVRKTYFALVEMTQPIARSGSAVDHLVSRGRKTFVATSHGQGGEARTDWTIMAEGTASTALLRARPVTGRMHQIRVQLSAMGCGILGDQLYGAGSEKASRLMLHAFDLSLQHPDGSDMTLAAPLPDDFLAVLDEYGIPTGASPAMPAAE
ncbi:MAG: RluA family pseudouridine synthase [Henriciella sp.]